MAVKEIGRLSIVVVYNLMAHDQSRKPRSSHYSYSHESIRKYNESASAPKLKYMVGVTCAQTRGSRSCPTVHSNRRDQLYISNLSKSIGTLWISGSARGWNSVLHIDRQGRVKSSPIKRIIAGEVGLIC